jgi:hypothetical protein
MDKRRFIPRWRKMTWALLIFTVVMAVSAIGAGVAVNATETASVADIRDCIVGGDEFSTDLPENPRFDEGCIEGSGSADDVVGLILFLWLIGFSVLSLIWFKRRPRSPSQPRPSGSLRRRP